MTDMTMSKAKTDLISDAERAGYTAQRGPAAVTLTRGARVLLVCERGRPIRGDVRLDLAAGMTIADCRAYLGLD